jgi:hypothetical protein
MKILQIYFTNTSVFYKCMYYVMFVCYIYILISVSYANEYVIFLGVSLDTISVKEKFFFSNIQLHQECKQIDELQN